MTTRFLKNYNDFVLFLTYIKEPDGDEYEPAMVVGGKAKIKRAFVIPLSAAYKYCYGADHPLCGHPTEYMVKTSKLISERIGLGGDRASSFKICGAIADHLEDLVVLKPRPDMPKQVIGEGRATIGSDTFDFEI